MVYLLDHFSHRVKCTLLDLVPDAFGSDLLLALENIGMRSTDKEGGSSGVRIDSDESGSEADDMSDNDSDQAADDNMQQLQYKTFIAINTVCYRYCLSFGQSDNLYKYTVISGYSTIFVLNIRH